MIDDTPSAMALAFLHSLQARGVIVSVRKNRLSLRPGSAFKSLTDVEAHTLKQYRDVIKTLVVAGAVIKSTTVAVESHRGAVNDEAAAAVRAEEEKATRDAERDAYIKAHDLETWRVLHFNDPEEIARRSQEAIDAMLSSRRTPIHDW